jgi:cobalamin-dependent methionine synthase I
MTRLEEQKELFELLAIEERLGVTLTGGFQVAPVHSLLGVYFHHPGAERLC